MKRRKLWLGGILALVLAVLGAVMVPSGESYADPADDIQTCSGAGGAASMGWILCPVMNELGQASEGLYDQFVESQLQVEPKLFTEGGNKGGAKNGWDTFRNIANSLLIVLFLVVIFSQLTGVGIDNYGIKKILPKIIVAAILMNLSYWLCVAAVDVSNILGNAFQSLFDTLASNIKFTNDEFKIADDVVVPIGSTMISIAIIGVLIAGAAVAFMAEPGMFFALLLGAIGVAVSIFFLFILLAVRQAAIVVLTVISPVAIACMMMPNTKSLFDKWLKLFEGLLLVYPIAGLLVGGGNYVGRLLLASGFGDGGFFTAVTAMVVGIVPVFFIPTVLKGSFSAMGNLGAKISSFGQRVGGAAQRATASSPVYKNAQERANEWGAMRRAGVVKNSDGTYSERQYRTKAGQRIHGMLAGGNRSIARSRTQFLQNEDAREREEEMLGVGFDAAAAGVAVKASQRRTEDYGALLATGNALLGDGTKVNPNNLDSVATYHAEALNRYNAATTEEGRNAAMAEVKAAQNYLSKTDAGRGKLQSNFEAAVRTTAGIDVSTPQGQAQAAQAQAGLQQAAAHIMDDYGGQYKAANRGEHAMMQDLASGAVGVGDVAGKVDSGEYASYGTSKYTAESLAGADDAALDRMIGTDGSGNLTGTGLAQMNPEALATLQATAYEALEKQKNGTLNIKPEVSAKLESIVSGNFTVTDANGNSGTRQMVAGYVPTASSKSAAQNTNEQMLSALNQINQTLHSQHGGGGAQGGGHSGGGTS